MQIPRISLLLLATSLCASADGIQWNQQRGQWAKEGFSKDTVAKTICSDAGNHVAFELKHIATSRDLFAYSKWEAERWGDPSGVFAPVGSWQAVSNAANDLGLTLWGNWGWDGAAASARPQPSDTTIWRLTLRFEHPVANLRIPIRGLNALLTSDGQNSLDFATASAFRRGVLQPAPAVASQGQAVIATGTDLSGTWARVVTSPTSDESAAEWRFAEPLDQLEITFTNRAEHPTPASFANGTLIWSFAVGNLSFDSVPEAQGSGFGWEARRTQLQKPGFDTASAAYGGTSSDGLVNVLFELDHIGTTAGLGSYSKWEIDRWGDPAGVAYAPGSWQAVTNATNDVVLACWGYWGWPLTAGGQKVRLGDSTTYRLRINFDRPVRDLSFQLNGINGFIKVADGFNSGDALTINAALGGNPAGNAQYNPQGSSYIRAGNVLTGDYTNQIDGGITGQHVSNDGSILLNFREAVDQVELVLVNSAGHHTPAMFRDGTQTWSFSLGSLSFRHDAANAANGLANFALSPAAKAKQSSVFGGHAHADLARDGNTNGNFWSRSVAHTYQDIQPWWEVDLGETRAVRFLRLWNRTDCALNAASDPAIRVVVSEQPFTSSDLTVTLNQPGVASYLIPAWTSPSYLLTIDRTARYVRVQRQAARAFLELAEVEVLGNSPATPLAGLTYAAYEGVWPTWPNFAALEPVATGTASSFTAAPKPRAAFVAMKYAGYVRVPAAGSYTFYANVPNSQATVAGFALWQPNASATSERSGTVTLAAGWHPFTVLTYERASSTPLAMSWSGPGLAKQAIAASALAIQPNPGMATSLISHLNAPALANEDDDPLSNFAEYALATSPYLAGQDGSGPRLETTATGIDAVYQRPVGLAVSYVAEISADLAAWTALPAGQTTAQGNGLETVRHANVANGLGTAGFLRLRMEVPEHGWLSKTPVLGWRKTSLRPGYQTHGLALNQPSVFAGIIAEASANRVTAESAGLANVLLPSRAYYLEITSGAHEGHRFDVLVASSADQIVALDLSAPHNTLAALPTADLAGSTFLIRPYWTLGAAYEKSRFRAHADPSVADQILFFGPSGYRTYALSPVGAGSAWTDLADSSLADVGGRVIPPGAGAFLCLHTSTSGALTITGQVRENAFIQPLSVGYNLLAEAHPLLTSASSRGLSTANGFLGASSPDLADQIYRWGQDVQPTTAGYQGFFLLDFGTTKHWANVADATLANQNNAPLFQPDRAVFLRLVESSHSSYRAPALRIP